MELDLQPGMYVVAVSGGVDSVALLHLLTRVEARGLIPSAAEESIWSSEPGPSASLRSARDDGKYRFVVAHYDHGIREDSAEDRRLVQTMACELGLPFVYHEGELGPEASEAQARQARYDFLHQVRQARGAGAIVTAHHQDDALETAILNMLRGTNRRGLSSLKSTDVVKRPLLHVPKKELLRYAESEGLRWREDSTNADERYARNYVRRRIMPRIVGSDREALVRIVRRAAELNAAIEAQAINYLHLQPATGVLDRHAFTMLPHNVAREIMAEWLLQYAHAELSASMLERLVVAAKTGRPGTRVNINGLHWLGIGRSQLALLQRER